MSNVYKSEREITTLQFYVSALELQVEITQYIMREKTLPKKWRNAIGYDIVKKADLLLDFIVLANSIYPTNFKELILRKILQTMAIATCYRIQNKLILAEKCVQTVKIKDITKIIENLTEEIKLLKGWKKTTKIIKADKDNNK